MLILEPPLLAFFRRAADRVMNFDEGVPPPPAPPPDGEAFLYVHVPFCQSLCPFCSFHRVEFREAKAARYFAALRREIGWYRDAGFRFSGVYVGGGTPTVAPLELERTLALVRESFPVREVSVETNPSDLTEDVLATLERAGVSRLSVGVQSFDDGLLRDMDRYDKYGSSAAIQARIKGALGRFRTLNVDMIFNVPRQTPEILERDLDTILALGVDQVSFYPLMSATEVRRKMASHMGRLDRRRQHDFYERIRARLAAAYRPSSAWCFDRGAQAIDEYIVGAGDYVGVGSGAFSYVNGTMYATTFSLNHYAQLAGSGQPAITKTRHLAPRERMRYEFLIRMFGMSMDRAWMERRFDGAFARTLWPELTAFRLMGALREDARGWHLTERGMYLWVLMMSSFFEGVNQFRAEMRASIREELV